MVGNVGFAYDGGIRAAGQTVSWSGTCTAAGGIESGNGTNLATCTFSSLDSNKTATATFSIFIVPTMTEWGMLIFILLAGIGSMYYLRRRRA